MENGAGPCGLDKPQVARDFINGQYSSVVVDLCNLISELVLILLSFLFFDWDFWSLRFASINLASISFWVFISKD